MPLPSTNLTLHLDASDTDHIWKLYQSGTPFHSGIPANGDDVQTWDDDDGKDLTFKYAGAPNWRTSTMVLPCLDFNGSSDQMALSNVAGTVPKVFSSIIDTAAFVILGSIRIQGGSTNATDSYDNDAIFTNDSNADMGVHVKNNAGAYTLNFYNFGTTADTVSLSAAVDTNYVFVYWHVGGEIYAELYTAAGLVASGGIPSWLTNVGAGTVVLGRNWNAGAFYNGCIGELAFYNAHNATDRANATAYMRAKWTPVAAGGASIPVLMAQYRQRWR